jgi:hypothetical protein
VTTHYRYSTSAVEFSRMEFAVITSWQKMARCSMQMAKTAAKKSKQINNKNLPQSVAVQMHLFNRTPDKVLEEQVQLSAASLRSKVTHDGAGRT